MFSALTILLYLTATVLQVLALFRQQSLRKIWVIGIGLAATACHCWLLYHWIDVGNSQNLTFFTLLSLLTWLIALLVIIMAVRKPLLNLGVLIFPLAALSIILIFLFPSQELVNTETHPRQLIHILLSVITFSVLGIAALQALVLALLEKQLRSRPTLRLLQKLPALETMETLLFQMIRLGFGLLTVLLVSSFYFYHHQLLGDMLQKAILVILAWLIFAALLTGRHYLGWRGRKAIYGTLLGVALIAIVYFGSQLFWEPHL